MADITSNTWREFDADNTEPSPNGLPPGILPSELHAQGRAVMGAVKRAHSRSNVMVTSTGTGNTYAIAYTVGPTAYVKGEVFRFFAHLTNTGAATLNINALGTRALLRADGSAVAPGEIVAGQVVSVAYDGVNFLAISITGKEFKSNVSIVKENDAILTIEDSGTAATSFRRKQIYSTKNDGASGNNWLFRQTRPSDGAIEDFYLKGGTGGTIWTTGNFNPSLKADLGGATFTGSVAVKTNAGVGSATLMPGSAERSGHVEFRDKDGARHGYIGWGNGSTIDIQAERGDFNFNGGTPRIGGNPIWHTGNFNPDLKATLNSNVRFSGFGPTGSDAWIYSDAGTNNLVLRSGPAATPRYTVLDADGTMRMGGNLRAAGSITATGDVIVGDGQHYSTIAMRDSDEGSRYVHNNSNLIGFLGKAGDWIFRVADDGAVWTKQFGDLEGRIVYHSNRGRDEANANTAANYAAKTTPTVNGNVFVAGGSSYGSVQPALSLFNGGVEHWNIMAVNDGKLYFRNGDNGDVRMILGRDGSLHLKQFGDLNNRIEDRASAWARQEGNRGRDEANNNSNANFFNKTTGTQQHVNNIPSFNASAIDIVRGGVLRARWTVDGNGTTILQNGDNGDNFFYVNTGGGMWTKQMGDVYSFIERRGREWADDRANGRVFKGGDTMTGDLTINKAYPNINFLYGGVRQWQAQVRENGWFYFYDQTGNAFNVAFNLDGGIWTRQFGDLNQRIEDRAYAWAATRQANLGFNPVEQSGGPYQGANKVRLGWDGGALRVSVDGGDHDRILHRSWINAIQDIRLVYAGDLDNNWNLNQSYAEPYGGGVLTSRYTTSYAAATSWSGGRWRYLQKQDSHGNWYTVGYA